MRKSKAIIYKCDLLSITENVVVNADESRATNIERAEVVPVETLFVQPTTSRKYFREIITRKLIPVYYEGYREDFYEYRDGITLKIIPKLPCYIKYQDSYINDIYQGDSLEIPTASEVLDYVEKHQDRESFSSYLDGLLLQAELYYQDALLKNNISEETKIKSITKSLKRKN